MTVCVLRSGVALPLDQRDTVAGDTATMFARSLPCRPPLSLRTSIIFLTAVDILSAYRVLLFLGVRNEMEGRQHESQTRPFCEDHQERCSIYRDGQHFSATFLQLSDRPLAWQPRVQFGPH